MAWSVPRVIRNVLTNKANLIDDFQPRELLAKFDPSVKLTVKQSSRLITSRQRRCRGRFFMYEEHRGGASTDISSRDDDDDSPTISVSPNEFVNLLHRASASLSADGSMRHYYWTSPVADAAPHLTNVFNEHVYLLHKSSDKSLLDPRGPSLWLGTSGSGTQCHYDVANNVILQLYGTKRVRVWRPSDGVFRLHTYPDSHPRARKSQVDLDVNDDDDSSLRSRYPQYYCTNTPLQPTLDIILRPGDALYLPSFWFHHVENGYFPGLFSGDDTDDVIDGRLDGPSVSLNSFALSKPMMIARKIFASASRPMDMLAFGKLMNRQYFVFLGALGTKLIRELNVVDCGEELKFIRKYLLEARYTPLVIEDENKNSNRTTNEPLSRREVHKYDLTNEQHLVVESCIKRILPDFKQLLDINNGDGGDGVGIALLVALHLLELWAVEIVGPTLVAKAWDDVIVK